MKFESSFRFKKGYPYASSTSHRSSPRCRNHAQDRARSRPVARRSYRRQTPADAAQLLPAGGEVDRGGDAGFDGGTLSAHDQGRRRLAESSAIARAGQANGVFSLLDERSE